MKRLLFIEDDKIVARIYAQKFSAEGYQVEIAADGESGLAALERVQPDVVLLDLMLPGIGGLEILKHIRATARFAALPVLVFSNIYLDTQAEEVLQAGATRCLPKATTAPREVIAAVNEAVAAPDNPPTLEREARSESELRAEFLATLPTAISEMRPLQQVIITADTKSERMPALNDLYRCVHSLASRAAVARVHLLARMATAFEALLKELCEKPNQVNVSTVRTVAQTVNFLAQMAERAEQLPALPNFAARIVAVDDEPISLRAVLTALSKAELSAESFHDPVGAFTVASEQASDLVILDINMPGMTGYELCRRLRELPAYRDTPVIFVTNLHDFQSRAKGAVSGADDLIAKPFLLLELTVKALTYVIKPRVPKAKM